MALIWDERLIGQAEAYELATEYPWRVGIRNGVAYLDCARNLGGVLCGQAILVLGAAANPFPTTTDALVGAVLRHGVTAHDLILNRKNRGHNNGADRGGLRDPGRGDRRAEKGPYAASGRHARRHSDGGVAVVYESPGRSARPGRHRAADDAR